MNIIVMYLIAFALFFAIDLLWLGIIAKDLYQKEIGKLLKKNVNWVAAIVFYLLFIGGVLYFAIYPAVEANQLTLAMFNGAFFGFLMYATYDLTNLATMKDWPLKITIIDLIWGTTLGFLTSTLSYLIISLF